jgi:PAS domain S-box-containing protein
MVVLNPYSTAYFLSALTSFGLILFIWVKGARSKEQLLISALCFAVFLWSFSAFICVNLLSASAALLFARLACLGTLLLPLTFLAFISAFLKKDQQLFWRIHNYLFLGLTVIAAWLDLTTGLFVTGLAPKGHFLFYSVPGPLFLPFTLAVYYAAVLGNFWLIFDLKKVHGHKLKQIQLLLFAFITSFSFGLLTVFAMFTSLPVTEFSGLAPIPYVGIATYAILKYRLMDISLFLKKTTVYSLVTTAITFIYLMVIIAFEFLFRSVFSGEFSYWMVWPIALMVAATFTPLREKLQSNIDRLFFRRTIQYQEAIREMSRMIASITNLNVLFRLIDQTLIKIMCLRTASVLILEEKKEHYVIEKTNGLPESVKGIIFQLNDPLIVYIKTVEREVLLDDINNILENIAVNADGRDLLLAVAKRMAELHAAIAVPAFVKGKLVGILCLGEKLSGEYYSQEDIGLLNTLAAEGGVAIENAKLYRDITWTRDYLNSLIENSDDAIFTFDLQGRVLTWNEAAHQIFGYLPAEVAERPLPIFNDLETRELIQKITGGAAIKNLELKRKNPLGQESSLLLTLSPIKGPGGEIIGVSGIGNDISERQAQENKLKEQMDELQEWHRSTVGRELKMIELEKEVNTLLVELKRQPRY